MNKKGNVFFGVIVGIVIFIFGILFIPFLADDIDTTRTDLDCTNTSITGGTMMTCLVVDLTIVYLIWFFVSIALGFIVGANT